MTTDLSKIRAAFIDLDGTLIDHFEALYRCYKYAADRLDEPSPSPDLVKRSVGGSMPVTIQKFFPEEKLDAAITLWREHFEEIHLENVVLLPGAKQLLDALERNEIRAAVFTNKIGRHSRNIIADLGLADRFAFVIGAEDTPYRKPDPEFSRHVLKKIGSTPEQALMIGDSPFDIAAGKNVGMASFVVTTGSHSASELAEEMPDRVFSSLSEIADCLTQTLNPQT